MLGDAAAASRLQGGFGRIVQTSRMGTPRHHESNSQSYKLSVRYEDWWDPYAHWVHPFVIKNYMIKLLESPEMHWAGSSLPSHVLGVGRRHGSKLLNLSRSILAAGSVLALHQGCCATRGVMHSCMGMTKGKRGVQLRCTKREKAIT
jgi:hypothetical protein